MTDLDDPDAVDRADPSGILRSILTFGEQCREGYDVGRSHGRLPDASGVTSLVVCGMGGSGGLIAKASGRFLRYCPAISVFNRAGLKMLAW